MLGKLFSSKTRVKLLTHFLTNPDEEFFVRQLTRDMHEQINSVRRELQNLESIGLLTSREERRKRYYRVNKEHVLFVELTNMVKKVTTKHGDIAVTIGKMGQVDLLVLSGAFTNAKNAPVDILAIGKLNSAQLEEYIRTLEKRTNTELRYAVLSKEDYLFRKNCQDSFIKSVLESSHYIAVNRLKLNVAV